MGYGLLGLKPDELFSLTLVEFNDMVNAKQVFTFVTDDREMERLAWQTALLMTATGNYGKKGVVSDKLYKRHYDDYGNETGNSVEATYKTIDKDEKEAKLQALLSKFNK